jgi:hypothetical protein
MAERSIHGKPGMVFIGYDDDGECLWDYPNGDNMKQPPETMTYMNVKSTITEGGTTQPRIAKGGVYSPADVKLIKDALTFYAAHNGQITDLETRSVANLLHRLNRI